MKKSMILFAAVIAGKAMAAQGLKGSDTLAGFMTDAIIASGLDSELQYVGTGSGAGEKALLAGEQNIAAMSREMKPEAVAELKAKGFEVVGHKVALDAIGLFAKADRTLPSSLTIDTIKAIFSCQITKWEDVPGSSRTGSIRVLRRDDLSGTTDTFKHITGIKQFGACVTAVAESKEIAEETANDAAVIGYAGLSAKRAGNKPLPISRKGEIASSPTVVNIRSFSYAFSRFLYVFEVVGRTSPAEAALIDRLKDRSFIDPIAQNNEFITLD